MIKESDKQIDFNSIDHVLIYINSWLNSNSNIFRTIGRKLCKKNQMKTKNNVAFNKNDNF